MTFLLLLWSTISFSMIADMSVSLPPFQNTTPESPTPPGRPQGHARTIYDGPGASPVYCTGVPLRPPWGEEARDEAKFQSKEEPLRPPWGWVGGEGASPKT